MTNVAFKKPLETYREDFTYANSEKAIKRFPFPYPEDQYMYSVNMEHHVRGETGSIYENTFDVDEHYLSEMEERRIVLEKDPDRFVTLSHMDLHQWDVLELLMESFAQDYPKYFSLTKDGDHWVWENHPLGIKHSFIFGDKSTLPCEPAEYITRQAQGDFVLMDQRDNDLYADTAMITCAADWSVPFDLGMSFMEWHGPVPLAHGMGVFERALKYLLMIRLGQPVRRLNWTLTINSRMDTSPEVYHEWGHERGSITPENVGEKIHLRVEVQTLFRLPRSNGMLFGIRTYLISMEDLCKNPLWAQRMHRVVKSLHPEIMDYKGITRYHKTLQDWLSQFDH
jgi:hypothetical protein|tara:strand:+ start:1938 stop:2954 length:1017 start_codon:yes stop_codon:yes gene_type:complete